MEGKLASAVLEYLVDLRITNSDCTNRALTGEPCIQCRERENVISRLEKLLVENSAVTAQDVRDRYSLYEVSGVQ